MKMKGGAWAYRKNPGKQEKQENPEEFRRMNLVLNTFMKKSMGKRLTMGKVKKIGTSLMVAGISYAELTAIKVSHQAGFEARSELAVQIMLYSTIATTVVVALLSVYVLIGYIAENAEKRQRSADTVREEDRATGKEAAGPRTDDEPLAA